MSRLFLSILCVAMLLTESVLLSGCKNEKADKSEVIEYTLSEFEVVDLGKGEVVTSDPDVVGIVKEVRVVNDSIIAFSQTNSNTSVILYNLNNGKFQRAMTRGSGPLEMMNVGSISSDSSGVLWMSGVWDHKVITARWNPDGEEALLEHKFTASEDLMRGISDNEGGIIALPGYTSDSRIVRISASGEVIDSLGVFPETMLPEGARANNMLFQGIIGYSPKSRSVAVVNYSWNEIDIHNLSENDTIRLIGPVEADIEVKKFERGEAYSFALRPLWLMFYGISAGPDSFYVGYQGVKVEKEEDFAHEINSILEFDWNGNRKRAFKPENEVDIFDIDYKNGILYTIENRPDPTLIKYNIK